MALVQRPLHGSYWTTKYSSLHPSCWSSTRLHRLSCTKLSCAPPYHSVAEAADAEDEVKGEGIKREASSILQQGERSLHVSSRRRHQRTHVPFLQKGPHFDSRDDDKFMREALCEAQKAAANGEVPVGAVLVSQGKVVARAHNRVEKENDPTAHAEMICIRNAARHIAGWRLLDSILYVTLEPCPMCAGALLQARVGAVVWGARNPLLGADGSWVSLFPRRPSAAGSQDQLLGSETNQAAQDNSLRHPFNPDIVVRGGVLADQSSEIMQSFFRRRRKESKKPVVAGSSLFQTLISAVRRALCAVVSFAKILWLDGMLHFRRLQWKRRH